MRYGSALTGTPPEEGWGKLSLVLQLVKRRPSDVNMTPDNSPDQGGMHGLLRSHAPWILTQTPNVGESQTWYDSVTA